MKPWYYTWPRRYKVDKKAEKPMYGNCWCGFAVILSTPIPFNFPIASILRRRRQGTYLNWGKRGGGVGRRYDQGEKAITKKPDLRGKTCNPQGLFFSRTRTFEYRRAALFFFLNMPTKLHCISQKNLSNCRLYSSPKTTRTAGGWVFSATAAAVVTRTSASTTRRTSIAVTWRTF